jgi:hypothetical protein
MAGLLTHLGAGLLGFLIIYFSFYKSKNRDKLIYGIVFIIANLAPDLVDFGTLSVKMGSLDPGAIMRNPLFHNLVWLGHTFSNWVFLALVILAVFYILYKVKKVSKKTLKIIIICLILLLVGVIIHLRLDILIRETSYWI